jgi:superfamily I DNA/RNA helicase
MVGDNRQAIYGFRGADSGSLDRLKKELNAHELGLTTTYRCPKKVVALAAQLVPDYEAAASAPEGVVRDIREPALTADAQPGDFVLSRKNAPLVRFCLAMLRTGKRARIEGRDIGAGLLALVRKFKARDLASLTKKLIEWEGKQVRKALAAKGGDVEAAAPKVQQIVDTRETIVALAEGLATVAELEMRIETLFSDTGEDQVVFSSVHKAKGLEKDRVFLIEESFKRKARGEEVATFSNDIEEVNIRYVAITRAKAELVWVKAKLQEAA